MIRLGWLKPCTQLEASTVMGVQDLQRRPHTLFPLLFEDLGSKSLLSDGEDDVLFETQIEPC